MVQLVRKKFSRNSLFHSRGNIFLICLVLEVISNLWGINNCRFHISILNCHFECLKFPSPPFSLAKEDQLNNCSRIFWKISNFKFFFRMKFGSLYVD